MNDSPLSLVVERLNGRVRPAGPNGYIARCPAHSDDRASLSITAGDDGRVLLHCHAGCTAQDVVAALGLQLSDLFMSRERDMTTGARRIVATYDYTDETGQLLSQSVRYAPKDFRQRRPDGRGGWDWKLGDVRHVLYNLFAVAAAPVEQTVFVVEGEKDTHTMRDRYGALATTNAGGAGKWRSEYNETVRGRHVVILPDNDPSGEKHARDVARSLHKLAASVKIVHLPGLPPKGDVSDWHGDADELDRLVENTPEFEPGLKFVDLSVRDDDAPENARDAEPLPILDLGATPEPVRWILPTWIEECSLVLVSGRPKVGKSTVFADLAAGCASNRPTCLGFPAGAFRALWVDGDQGPNRCRRLFQRLRANDIPGLFVVSGARLSLRDPEGVARLEATILAHSIRVVFLDSWSTLTPGANERDETEQTALLANLRRIADERDVTFVLIHHNRKESRDGSTDPVEAVRGSTAIAACVDTIISARPTTGGAALDLAVVAARADERPQERVEHVQDGDCIVLRAIGAPAVAETKQGRAETFIIGLFQGDGRKIKRAEIVAACDAGGHAGRVVDDACGHLVGVDALHRPERGIYQLARFKPDALFQVSGSE